MLTTWLLNECGLRATHAEAVKPELVALANRFLLELGVIHETQDANLYVVTEALLSASNNNDLAAERKAMHE